MSQPAHGAAETASAGFPPFDASLFSHQIFWFFIAFGALYIILATKVLPTIGKTLADRKGAIEADLRAAQLESEAAEIARQNAHDAQVNARENARLTLDTMRKEIEAENANAQTLANSEAEETIKKAETAIAKKKSKTLETVLASVDDLAGDIFTSLTGAKPSAAILKAVAKTGGK